jgi:hypothetical protein
VKGEVNFPNIMQSFDCGSSILVVVFTSKNDCFDLFKTLQAFDVNKLFLRDRSYAYYQNGVDASGADSVEGLAGLIRQHIVDRGVGRSVFVGASLGAYAALLYGFLCDATEVHAFAPQTLLCSRGIMDGRWPSLNALLERMPRTYFDLEKVLCDGGDTVYHVYYDDLCDLDVAHADRLCGLRRVFFHLESGKSHNILLHYHKENMLHDLVKRIIYG